MNERLIELKVLNCLMVDEHSCYFSMIDEGDFFHPELLRWSPFRARIERGYAAGQAELKDEIIGAMMDFLQRGE